MFTKEALEHCQKNYSCITHYSFGDRYIKYNGENFVWNDGSKVDTQKLPNDDGWVSILVRYTISALFKLNKKIKL